MSWSEEQIATQFASRSAGKEQENGTNLLYETYDYIIDQKDVIVAVSKNWRSFADRNLGGSACLPERIIGSSLWDHICDGETKHLYEMILHKVREHSRQAKFPFRCDSPSERRFLKLSVIPIKDGSVHFKSEIIKTESREPVELLRGDVQRSEKLIRICSMCKKIAVSETEWQEVEVAVETMGLFQKRVLPKFTHGICQCCFDMAIAELDGL